MDEFVARQPIFNRFRRLFAYRLLFGADASTVFADVDADLAASGLLSSCLFNVGIERITNGRKALVQFPHHLLLRGLPLLFPAHGIAVEILGEGEPTDELVAVCQTLASKGYLLVLDDFYLRIRHRPLMALAAIIKVDFSLRSMEEIRELVAFRARSRYRFKLLAEQVKTYETYLLARNLGFVYFRGAFFSRPEVVRNREISPSQMLYLKLVLEINRAEFEVNNLEALIRQDAAISYKLLRCINSAYYARLQPIRSIRNAIAYLGERGIRMFVSLIATSRLCEGKPDELLRVSGVRACFLEQVARELRMDGGEAFLMGLFSHLDAILDAHMEYLIGQIPLAEDIKQALVHQAGPLFPLLRLIRLYEAGQWSEVDRVRKELGLNRSRILDHYLDAVRWSGAFI